MTQNGTRRLLAICSYSPGQQVKAREALDAILATAVFGQSLKLVFCGAGVWQLVKAQGDYSGSDKALADSLAALPLYDIDAVYADEQSLLERGLGPQDLLPLVQSISSREVAELIADCHGILSF
jgi:tRNA 2-thiouridine synthesizing protein C